MEDRIEKLCREFVAEKDAQKARDLSGQLRTELHQFIESLRSRLTQYPVVDERRVQGAVPPPALMVSEKPSRITAVETAPEVSGAPKPAA